MIWFRRALAAAARAAGSDVQPMKSGASMTLASSATPSCQVFGMSESDFWKTSRYFTSPLNSLYPAAETGTGYVVLRARDGR